MAGELLRKYAFGSHLLSLGHDGFTSRWFQPLANVGHGNFGHSNAFHGWFGLSRREGSMPGLQDWHGGHVEGCPIADGEALSARSRRPRAVATALGKRFSNDELL